MNTKFKRKCCIPGCLSTSYEVKLSQVPRIKHVFEVWQKILRAKCGLELRYGLDRRICSLHFEAKYLKKNTRTTRSAFSFPTLFSAREIESGKPDEPISVDFRATSGVYYPKQIDPDEVKYGTNVKSSLEEHKLYCATHDHQYNANANAAILTGIEIPPSPTPSAPAEDDVKSLADVSPCDDENYFQAVIPEPKNFEEVTVTDNLAKLPEILCATPGTKDDAELCLLDILDPDLLTDSIAPQNLGSSDDNLHNILSEAWPQVLAGGLASDAKQKIIDRYPRPNNCKLLQTPMMNVKMAELLPEKVMANDGKWARMQQYLGTAITAISRAMETLLLHQSTEKALRHLTNAGLILCDLHYIHTKIRKVTVTPFVDATTQAVIKDCTTHDKSLFGMDFMKKWRAAKKREPKKRKVRKKVRTIVKKKKRATCSEPSLVAYSGQWRAPLPLVRNRRAIKRRRPRQPGSGVKRDGNEEILPMKQDNAIGNVIILTPPDNEESHSHMQTDTEDRWDQGEVTDYVRRDRAIEMTDSGAGTKFTVRNSAKQIEHYDAWGHKITLVPPDINKSQSYMETKMKTRHTQVGPVVDQLNQPKNTKSPKKPVERKKPSDSSRPFKKRNTKKIQQIEQSHMQIQRVGLPRTHPLLEDPIQRPCPQAQEVQVQPTIQNYPNNRIMITRGSIPLVLPPQLHSRDMPSLHFNDMPEHRSNRDPPDLIENAEPGVSLLLNLRQT